MKHNRWKRMCSYQAKTLLGPTLYSTALFLRIFCAPVDLYIAAIAGRLSICVDGNRAVSRVWRRCRRRSSANNWTREVNELIASHQYDAYELRKSQSAYSHTGSMIINSSRVITKRWKIIVITRTKCERITPGQTRRRHIPRPAPTPSHVRVLTD